MSETHNELTSKLCFKDCLRKYALWAVLVAGFAIMCICLPCAALFD